MTLIKIEETLGNPEMDSIKKTQSGPWRELKKTQAHLFSTSVISSLKIPYFAMSYYKMYLCSATCTPFLYD